MISALSLAVLALVATLSGGTVTVQEAAGPETFLEANAAYEENDYDRAVLLYGRLVEAGYDSGQLYYNLGNAYLRNGELGRSIASYRRAWLRLPRDEDVRANLEFARQTTQDALAAPGPSAVSRALFFWHYGMSIAELQVAALALNLLFWLLVAIRLVKRRSEVLRWLTVAVLIPLIRRGVVARLPGARPAASRRGRAAGGQRALRPDGRRRGALQAPRRYRGGAQGPARRLAPDLAPGRPTGVDRSELRRDRGRLADYWM